MVRTISQVSEDTLTLERYLSKVKDGTELSWESITHDTGIEMDDYGRRHLKTAFSRLNREYSSIRGYGIKVAEASDTMPILAGKLSRVDSAIKHADKSSKTLQSQFFDKLPKEEQEAMLYLNSIFGAMRVSSTRGKQVYTEKKLITANKLNIPYHQTKS